jgi:hypothetical protein
MGEKFEVLPKSADIYEGFPVNPRELKFAGFTRCIWRKRVF